MEQVLMGEGRTSTSSMKPRKSMKQIDNRDEL